MELAAAKVTGNRIPVLRPRLPPAEALLPYLRRIDDTRVYTNWGPLASELELRLCAHFGLPEGGVTSSGSGTSALIGAILATAGRPSENRPSALVPAFTFVATAVALEQCGYQVQLADVDPHTWMLDPERLVEDVELGRVGLVVPVAPFGRPVPQAPWRAFRERTGIPVVIDGAASFEGLGQADHRFLGEIPTAISFHATKSFATGEGGCVAISDVGLAERVTRALNFGFFETRDATTVSTNGKMSEYHAAVGLAELDGWEEKGSALRRVTDTYRRVLGDAGLSARLIAAPEVGSTYPLFICESAAEASRVERALRRGGVDYRFWYGGGLHRQSHFSDVPHDGLDVTDDLAPRLLGLPMAVDLAEASIARIADALLAGVARA